MPVKYDKRKTSPGDLHFIDQNKGVKPTQANIQRLPLEKGRLSKIPDKAANSNDFNSKDGKMRLKIKGFLIFRSTFYTFYRCRKGKGRYAQPSL